MLLHLSDRSPEPLHHQISRQIRERILSGGLPPGADLASIRALARDNRVSVITVQRAYEDLEREGLIHARRGKGFFVTHRTAEEKQRIAEERFADQLRPLIEEALSAGLEPDAVRGMIDRFLGKGEKR